MLILILIILLVIIVVPFIKDDWDIATLGIMVLICILPLIGVGIFTIVCIDDVLEDKIINDKINMYKKENIKIENQIDELVKEYMNYENDTLDKFKSENSITLIQLYPDLKSNELVVKEIETYTNNNVKIKELKEKKLNIKKSKWLLYFGK